MFMSVNNQGMKGLHVHCTVTHKSMGNLYPVTRATRLKKLLLLAQLVSNVLTAR